MQIVSIRIMDRIGFNHPFNFFAVEVVAGAAAILDLASPSDVVGTRIAARAADVILVSYP